MATIHVTYACGCGFNSQSVEEAANHADVSGHVVNNIAGSINPNVRRARPAAESPSSPQKTLNRPMANRQQSSFTPAQRPVQQPLQPKSQPVEAEFSNLRNMLKR